MKKQSSRTGTAAVVLILAVALLTALALRFHLTDALRLGNLLQTSLEQPQLCADLQITFTDADRSFEAGALFYRQTDEDGSLYGLQSGPVQLWFANQKLIFDNGRAYALEGLLPSIPITGKGLLKLLPLADIQTEAAGTGTVYHLTFSGSQLHSRVEAFPEDAALRVKFTGQADLLTSASLSYTQPDRTVSADIVLSPEALPDIPKPVLDARTADAEESIRVLAPLVQAVRALSRQEFLAAELELHADCGPVKLSDSTMLYRTGSGVFLDSLGKLRQLEHVDLSGDALLGLGYALCRDGLLTRVDHSGSYSLIFPAQRIQDTCTELVPQIGLLPVSYADGSLMLTVRDNQLESVRLEIGGSMPILFTTAEISLGISLSPLPPESAVLPEALA